MTFSIRVLFALINTRLWLTRFFGYRRTNFLSPIFDAPIRSSIDFLLCPSLFQRKHGLVKMAKILDHAG